MSDEQVDLQQIARNSIPRGVIDELERLREAQLAANEAFGEAVKEQAERYELDPQGLAKFIRARVSDKLEKLEAERDTVEQLTMLFTS